MTVSMLDRLATEQMFLVQQAMAEMDSHYDEEMRMLWNVENGDNKRHSTRASAHYAVGLLIRNGPGDRDRACAVLHSVLDMQLDCPGEIYHGTFKTSPQTAAPPLGGYPWNQFGPGFAHYMTSALETISNKLSMALGAGDSGQKGVEEAFGNAVAEVIPTVWRTYDPNWREFIASACAVILEHFEQELPGELVSRMDESMKKAVAGSIDRSLSDAVPMNTNIELMHLFIVHYYGFRYGNEDWIRHADQRAEQFLKDLAEFGTLAEFNSTTYYGVDLTVLGMIRKYARTEKMRAMGHSVEQGLWENIALFYNPHLENLAGPYARAYEMEMTAHSSIGVFLYLTFGESLKHLAGVNCETSHDPIIALIGSDVPEHVKPLLLTHTENRQITRHFRELCERDKPGENRFICKATAWIEQNLMVGALSGSRNTNGQLHPATIHWRNSAGDRYYLRLIRREPSESWNTHLRGYYVDAEASQGKLSAVVMFNTDKPLDVCFEVCGPRVSAAGITSSEWMFPGLSIRMEGTAPEPLVRERDGCVEIIYPYRPHVSRNYMAFKLDLLFVG